MNRPFKHRKGSLTILAIFIFLIMMTSITLMLTFSTLQAALSRNQIEKVQSRYKTEDGLNKLLYDEKNMEKYIKGQILRRYRLARDSTYAVTIEKDDELKNYIKKAGFTFQNIDTREIVSFEIESVYNNLIYNIRAYGPCINEIFELNKPLLDQKLLTEIEIPLFISFIEKMEKENWAYNFDMGSNYKKVNTKNNIAIEFISQKNLYNLGSPKKLIQNYGQVNQISETFTDKSLIIHLKRDSLEVDKIKDRSMTIGSTESNGLITMIGVLYLEGDLIINQDFEFEGLIIMNEGNIIVNSPNKATIKGMIINKGEELDINSLNLIHDQKAIYKAGSFLPGFLDIDIQVIKKY